jgi:aminobenzoyl-glutamate utilization protein A
MKAYALNIIEGAAKMHGVEYEIKEMGSANSLTSDEEAMRLVKTVCEQHLHMPVAETMSLFSGGSEDVSYMMNRVQEQGGHATFMRLLTELAGPGHNRRFDFDEAVLANGVKIFCGTVYYIGQRYGIAG